jgi:hypothetical protein
MCLGLAFGIVWPYAGQRAGWVLAHRDLAPSQSVECEGRALFTAVCNLFTEASFKHVGGYWTLWLKARVHYCFPRMAPFGAHAGHEQWLGRVVRAGAFKTTCGRSRRISECVEARW